MEDVTMQSMRVTVTALTVAMEEMVKEGKRLLADTPPHEVPENMQLAITTLEDAIKGLNQWQETGDFNEFERVVKVMMDAQKIIGDNPFDR